MKKTLAIIFGLLVLFSNNIVFANKANTSLEQNMSHPETVEVPKSNAHTAHKPGEIFEIQGVKMMYTEDGSAIAVKSDEEIQAETSLSDSIKTAVSGTVKHSENMKKLEVSRQISAFQNFIFKILAIISLVVGLLIAIAIKFFRNKNKKPETTPKSSKKSVPTLADAK